MDYQTYVRVHLQNIRHNLENVRQRVGEQRKILVAVKANAYGHGAVAVGKLAEKIGMDWLGVATVPEGQELRRAGITLPILKFSPVFPEETAAAIDAQLALVVIEEQAIRALNQAALNCGKKISVHLKIDTGMGRIGCCPEQASALALLIDREMTALSLEGLCTHLPVSDDPDPTFTKTQITAFAEICQQVQNTLGHRIDLVHAANSGAILAHPEGWFDMVRPGIMTYGFRPDVKTPDTVPLRPGLSFLTRVSHVKRVAAGTSIGYGRTWVAPNDTCIGTIPAGYADGFNRLFSNRGRALIDGTAYPVVGRVCMDQSMLDLGPDTNVKVGDAVVLIGKSGTAEISAYEWAEKLGTITYEVTSQINHRVQRHPDADDLPLV